MGSIKCSEPLSIFEENHCTTPCGHNFHVDCLARWHLNSASGHASCPICRQGLGDAIDLRNSPNSSGSDPQHDGPSTNRPPGHNTHRTQHLRSGHRQMPSAWGIGDTTATSGQHLARNPCFTVTTSPDIGLPRSLPPLSCVPDFTEQWDPLLILSPATSINQQQAALFHSECPWLHVGPSDAYAVAEAAAIRLGLYTDTANNNSTRCLGCTHTHCLEAKR